MASKINYNQYLYFKYFTSPEEFLIDDFVGWGLGLVYPSNWSIASAADLFASFLLGPEPVQVFSSTST